MEILNENQPCIPKDKKEFLENIKGGNWEKVLVLMMDYKLTKITKLNLLQEAIWDFSQKKLFEKANELLKKNEDLFIYYNDYDKKYFDTIERVCEDEHFCSTFDYGENDKENRLNKILKDVETEIEDEEFFKSRTSLREDHLKKKSVLTNTYPIANIESEVVENKTPIKLDEIKPKSIEFPFPAVVNVVAFSSNGEYLATGSSDGYIEFFDLKTGKHRTDLLYQQEKKYMRMCSSITALTVTNDFKIVVGGNTNGYIGCCYIQNNEFIQNFQIPGSTIVMLHCDSNDRFYALTDNGIFNYNFFIKGQNTKEIVMDLKPNPNFLISTDNRFLITSTCQKIYIYSMNIQKILKKLKVNPGYEVCCIYHHPFFAYSYLICGKTKIYSTDHQFNVKKEYYTLEKCEDSYFTCSALSSRGIMFAGTQTGRLISYDIKDYTLLSSEKVHDSKINCLISHPKLNLVASCGKDGKIKFTH